MTSPVLRTAVQLAFTTVLFAQPLHAQAGPSSRGLDRVVAPAVSPTAVKAMRAAIPPVIDGRDDDAVWRAAPPITAFRVYRPVEDGDPQFRTEAKVAFDATNIYVFVRAFDPHPDSIVGLLARRDTQTPSDLITVFIDSYHDRRNGFEFGVNPAGVKTDYAISQDGNEDIAWDGIWDVATTRDSLGWTAEFRIPLSQLRYAALPSNTFGFTIARMIERTTEQSSWPLYRVSRPGLASQLGELTGLDHLAPPHRTELAPYVVTKNVSVPDGSDGFGRSQRLSAGADFKVAAAPNLTLTGTVNPDFGQVEADPAVLNLTAFETFFPEHRPFFLEGNGLFQFSVNCSAVNCNNEQLFYSRRIGRAPQLGGLYGGDDAPTTTTILGAGKLTGRIGGLAIGVVDAVAQREAGVGDATIEPATNYAVVRATQDFANGASGVGMMFTGVNRALDSWTSPVLRSEAYVGALEFRHQFFGRKYQLSGSLDLSRVAGSAAAIAATQRDPVHLYQRPDGPLEFDSTRTSLTGDAEEIHFGKISGAHLNFETSYLRRSPGFEINDLGYLQQADQQSWNNWAGLSFNRPTSVYQSLRWNLNWWQFWSAAGLSTERAANTNIHVRFNNRWWLHTGGTIGQLGTTWCDRCARGGPAVRQDPYLSPWMSILGDDRHRIIPSLSLNYFETSGGRSHSLSLNPQLTLNASSRFTATVGTGVTDNHSDNQWYGAFTDGAGVTHYTFAHLDQQTLSLTADLAYTITTTLSVQWHLQPFVSRGTWSDLRELNNPAAADYLARYRSYSDSAHAAGLGGIDAKQFNSNLVFRWEYRPGSTLFVVWTQGRNDFQPVAGSNGVSGALHDLFTLPADNTFLVKLSYWLSR